MIPSRTLATAFSVSEHQKVTVVTTDVTIILTWINHFSSLGVLLRDSGDMRADKRRRESSPLGSRLATFPRNRKALIVCFSSSNCTISVFTVTQLKTRVPSRPNLVPGSSFYGFFQIDQVPQFPSANMFSFGIFPPSFPPEYLMTNWTSQIPPYNSRMRFRCFSNGSATLYRVSRKVQSDFGVLHSMKIIHYSSTE